MELLYVWIGTIPGYDFYNHTGFGFNGKYNIKYDYDYISSRLTIIEKTEYNENFYSSSTDKTLKSLTCIVGENGAGKTSLLEIINKILRLIFSPWDITSSEFLVVFKVDGKIKYYNNIYEENTSTLKNIDIKANIVVSDYFNDSYKFEDKNTLDNKRNNRSKQLANLREDLKSLTVINYSTLFDDSFFDNSSFNAIQKYYSQSHRLIDLSSAFLLYKYGEQFKENQQIKKPDYINIYKCMELKNKVIFYANLLDGINELKDLVIGNKDYFNANILREALTISCFPIEYDDIHKTKYRQDFLRKENNLINDLYDIIDKYSLIMSNNILDSKKSEKMRFLWSVCLAYWLIVVDTLAMFVDVIAKSNKTSIDSNSINDAEDNPKVLIEKLIPSIMQIFPDYQNATDTFTKSLDAFKVFYDLLDEQVSITNFRVRFMLGNNSQKVLNLIDSYYNSLRHMGFGEYVQFSFEPRLCSGEQNMLTLFSRLYSLIYNRDTKIERSESAKKKEDSTPTRDNILADNILLMIDEGETTFHPAWQKKYIFCLIEYLTRIFKGKNIQLILTTNNPIILSDVLPEDVVLLKNKQRLDKQCNKAFGSNILDLYSEQFFIDDGLMGKFAQVKIKEVLDWIRKGCNGNPNDKKYTYIIDNIGDEHIRYYLNSLINSTNLLRGKND